MNKPASFSVGNYLQQLLAEQSQARILQFSTELIVRKSGMAGVRLTAAQKRRLKRWVQKGGGDSFSIRPKGLSGNKQISITITPRDVRRLMGKLGAQLVKDTEKATEAAIKAAVPHFRRVYGKTWPAHHRELAKLDKGFQDRLLNRYRAGFELLAMHLTLARELGEEVNQEVRSSKTRGKRFTFLDVQTRLHARACQIANEVTVLVRAGYADGAMARWRSLHEVSIVLQFVAMHGAEMAVRYADHEAIESLKAARGYNDKAERLKYQPYTPAELERIAKDAKAIAAKYEPDYDSEYGWAASALGKRKPNFADIEKAVGLDHFRPYYKFASHNVHANPKGIFYRLSVLGEREILPTGPTNVGLTDPVQNTALSVAQATSVIARLTPDSVDRWCVVGVLNGLVSEIATAFWSSEQAIQSDEARLRKKRSTAGKK